MNPESASLVRSRAVNRLREALLAYRPGLELDGKGYCRTAADNLVCPVRLDEIEADFAAGAGNELRNKFRAPHSSSALAVNSFAPLREQGCMLDLADETVRIRSFEAKRPTGLPRAQPPHLDVIADGDEAIVAIESKCLEPLTPKIPKFSLRYRDVAPDLRASPWFAEMLRILSSDRPGYLHLDAAQLIKHAFGLLAARDDRPTTLLYLFWEPLDAADWPIFAAHRSEIARFAGQVLGSDRVRFASSSYPELWRGCSEAQDPGLRRTAEEAMLRYEVALRNG